MPQFSERALARLRATQTPIIINAHERSDGSGVSVTIDFPFLVSWRTINRISEEFRTGMGVEWKIRPRLQWGAWVKTSSRVKLGLPLHTPKNPVIDRLLSLIRQLNPKRRVVLN